MRQAAVLIGLACYLLLATGNTAARATPVDGAVWHASAGNVTAPNSGDYETMAAQWTASAELVQGRSRAFGRETLVASIRGWLEHYAEARLTNKARHFFPLATTLARVEGTMTFSRPTDTLPVVFRFASLRVLEDGRWRLADSVVEPTSAAAVGGGDSELSDETGWRSLGFFAMARVGAAEPGTFLSLTIDQQGHLRGTCYNAVSASTQNVTGSVDKKSQRTCWTIGDKKLPVYEAGLANLPQQQTTVLVHCDGGTVEQMLLVRIENPEAGSGQAEAAG